MSSPQPGRLPDFIIAGAMRSGTTALNSYLRDHPDIAMITKTLPQDCAMCHKEDVPAGALNTQTHRIHYENPGENQFIERYQGECLACHSLNPVTGEMAVKQGPKNW